MERGGGRRGEGLLGVQVSDCSSDDAGDVGGPVDGELGQAEVRDLGPHVAVEKDVAALQIPVDDRRRAARVKILDAC